MAVTAEKEIESLRIPFIGNITNRAIDQTKDQRFVNCYFDLITSAEGVKNYWMVKRPGYAVQSSPSAAATGRGCYSWEGSLYSVWGTKLYKGTTDSGITMTTSTGLVKIEPTRPGAGTPKLVFSDGVKIFTVTTGGTWATVTTNVPANTRDFVYLDGYGFVMKDTGIIYHHDLDDPATWDTSKNITMMMGNQTGVGLARQGNYVLGFSRGHQQSFYDAANSAGSVLTNVEQSYRAIGCAANDTIAFDEEEVIWVTQSPTGVLP